MAGKRGRPTKITEEVKKEVYTWLRVGGSLADAADSLGMNRSTLQRAKKSDPVFAAGVRKATKDGKKRLLGKIGKATSWQAAAWMLERRWGKEFGRREHHNVEMSGKNGGPVKTETTVKHTIDYDQLRNDLESAAAGRFAAGGVPENGN